jgi:hypothetical protein
MHVPGLADLRDSVRTDPVPPDTTILVRGGPDNAAKLTAHAVRVQRAFTLDGAPVLGISVFAALDDIGPASIDGILAGKLATYRVVHELSPRELRAAGLMVLPTFGRPHMTIVLPALDKVDALLAALGPCRENPHYAEMVRRRRG